jgi:hypothetical protein
MLTGILLTGGASGAMVPCGRYTYIESRMDTHASNEQLTRAPPCLERRVGRNDRRSGITPPSPRVEPGDTGVRAAQSEKAGRQSKPRPPLNDDRSWGVQEVAYFLNVSESTVRNLERDGELPALPRIGTRVIFDPKIVRSFRDGWRPPPRGRAPAGTLARSGSRVQR